MNGLGRAFQRDGGTQQNQNAVAVNGLGSQFAVKAGNPTVPDPAPPAAHLPPGPLRLKASEAVALLERDPETWAPLAAGELARPEPSRRTSVLEALAAHERAALHTDLHADVAEAMRLRAVAAGDGPE